MRRRRPATFRTSRLPFLSVAFVIAIICVAFPRCFVHAGVRVDTTNNNGVADGGDETTALLAQASALRIAGSADPADMTQAFNLFKRVADQNVSESREAHYALAEMYEQGEVVDRSSRGRLGLAEHHYLQAASFGSHQALFKLALLDPIHTTDRLTAARPPIPPPAAATVTATAVVEKQAEAGAAGAGAEASAAAAAAAPTAAPGGSGDGNIIAAGARRNPVQQLSQYQTAALAANPDAAVALGYRYKFGVDVVANCSLAATYYEFAVNAGMAQFLSADTGRQLDSEYPTTANKHSVGLLTKTKSFTSVFSSSRPRLSARMEEYYQYSAIKGDPDAMYRLGKLLYSTAADLLSSPPTAAATTAATSSSFPGMNLGMGTGMGMGGDDDNPLTDASASFKQAFELFVMAADGGSAEAHAGLGHMYYEVCVCVRASLCLSMCLCVCALCTGI